jgi:methionyl-tRNA formyltransferase
VRLILMGTGPFAVPSFDAIRAQGHEIICVVTRPSVASSGKKDPPVSPVRQWASNHDLSIVDPISINDPATNQWLASLQADLMVVCDYGQILSKAALETTRLGGINLHGSLLPRHRGAAPVQWSILAGDARTGVSIIHMTPTLDGGPILHQSATDIGNTENSEQLEARLSQIGVESTLASIALLETKASLTECSNLGLRQDKALATKAPRLAKEDGELNCHYPVQYLDRLIRGLQPWPGTFAHAHFPDGKSIRILISKAMPVKCNLSAADVAPGDLIYGDTLTQLQSQEPRLLGHSLCAVAIDGVLAIPIVQPAGKRLMLADEFLRGYSRFAWIKLSSMEGSHRLLNQMCQIP